MSGTSPRDLMAHSSPPMDSIAECTENSEAPPGDGREAPIRGSGMGTSVATEREGVTGRRCTDTSRKCAIGAQMRRHLLLLITGAVCGGYGGYQLFLHRGVTVGTNAPSLVASARCLGDLLLRLRLLLIAALRNGSGTRGLRKLPAPGHPLPPAAPGANPAADDRGRDACRPYSRLEQHAVRDNGGALSRSDNRVDAAGAADLAAHLSERDRLTRLIPLADVVASQDVVNNRAPPQTQREADRQAERCDYDRDGGDEQADLYPQHPERKNHDEQGDDVLYEAAQPTGVIQAASCGDERHPVSREPRHHAAHEENHQCRDDVGQEVKQPLEQYCHGLEAHEAHCRDREGEEQQTEDRLPYEPGWGEPDPQPS